MDDLMDDLMNGNKPLFDAKEIMDAVPTVEIPLPMYEMLVRATERVAALDDYMKSCDNGYSTISKGIVCAILALEMSQKEED